MLGSVHAADEEATMEYTTSRDGTRIAYERAGAGPPAIIIGGALSDHTGGQGLAAELVGDLTTIVYDRRSRGHSGDESPGIGGAVEREVADLAARGEAAGRRAIVAGGARGGVRAPRATLE